jgi:serine/threonine protein kinase
MGLRNLFRCLGQAVCARGLRALVGAIPFGEAVCDIAADAYERLRRESDEEKLAAVEEAVRASPAEVKHEADAVAAEVAADQPPEVRAQLAAYLGQVPAVLRRSLRRPSDPTGTSVPITFSPKKPEDLLQFLPARPPRFKPGDRPPGVGDWELVELLGVGGFGEVWKARHVFFDGIAPVALKFCLDPAARDRLLRYEAGVLNQVMRQGRHPGIVPLLDAYLGTDPPCLKYEFIADGDLSGLVRFWEQTPDVPRWQSAARVVQKLAEIVGFAHRLSPPVVHRDLKPANVLVQRTAGDVALRVTDFGIGGVAALPALRASRQGTTSRGDLIATSLRGSHTPLYASPQQVRGDDPDPRDDVHALGVIWYQMLTGDLGSGPPTGLWADDLEEAGMGRELVRLLGACVAAKAERRPADAAVLAEKLTAACGLAAAPAKPQAAKPPPVEDRLDVLLRQVAANPFASILDLTNKQVGDEGVVKLTSWPHLAKVSVLYLNGNQITSAGVKALAESPHVVNLNSLNLWDNHVGDEGAAALAASPYLANLTSLNLGSNRLGDDGVRALAMSPHLVNLTSLILVSNHIGDVGALALADSAALANLAELKPLGNRITAVGVTALQRRFGKRVRVY